MVTAWGWGVGQRIVRIGGQRTFTDSEGRFTFEKVSTGRREPPDYLLDQVTFCAVRPADKL